MSGVFLTHPRGSVSFLLSCCGMACGLFLLVASSPSRADEASVVPLSVVGRVVFVEASVNGGPLKPFILDTGATETLLTPSAAEQAGMRVMGPANKPASRGTVRSLAVGNARLVNLSVLVYDPPQAFSLRLDRGINYHGILGYTFLSRFVTTVDYVRKKAYFVPVLSSARRGNGVDAAATNRQGIPVHVRNGLIFVKARINGQYPATLLLDTGSAEALILPGRIPALERLAKPLPGYTGVSQFVADTVSVGSATGRRIPFIVHALPQERRAAPGYDGILGYPFLSNFAVTINYRNQMIVLEPTEGTGDRSASGGSAPKR